MFGSEQAEQCSGRGYQFELPFEQIAAREPVRFHADRAGAGFLRRNLGELWRDLKFDMKHQDKFGRIVIVSTKRWEEWGTKFSDALFRSAEMRFFAPEQRGDAGSWMRGGRTALS